MASDSTFLKEGNLEKKSRFLGIWRKRWTVLAPSITNSSNHNLSTYKNERVYKSPTEVIRVDHKTRAECTGVVKGFENKAFTVENTIGTSTERFIFRATSAQDRDEWLESIRAIQGTPHSKDPIANGFHDGHTKIHVSKPKSELREEELSTEYKEEEEIILTPPPFDNILPEKAPFGVVPFGSQDDNVKESAVSAVSTLSTDVHVDHVQNDMPVMPSQYMSSLSTGIYGNCYYEPMHITFEPVMAVEDDNSDTVVNTEPDHMDISLENRSDIDNQTSNLSKQLEEQSDISDHKPTQITVEDEVKSPSEEIHSPPDSINADEADEAGDNVGDMIDVIAKRSEAMAIQRVASMTDDDGSTVSSYRSDGTGPFGDRWGDWNDSEEDTKEETKVAAATFDKGADSVNSEHSEIDMDAEETKESPNEILDTSDMLSCNVVVIGDKEKSTVLAKLLENGSDNVYSEMDMIIDDILCSFHDTPEDLSHSVSAIAQSDIALVVISMDTLQTSLESIKDYIRILSTFGVERCICCLSGMQRIDYNSDQYTIAKEKLEKMFKKIGMKMKKILVIPTGVNDNLSTSSENMGWYKGWTLKNKKLGNIKGTTLVEAIHAQSTHFGAKRELEKPFVIPISAVTENGICGKVEQGSFVLKDTTSLCVASVDGNISVDSVESVHRSGCAMDTVGHGDYITVQIPTDNFKVGDVLYASDNMELKACQSITAMVASVSSSNLGIGYEGMICIRSVMRKCELTSIEWKSTKDGKELEPDCLGKGDQGKVTLMLKEPMIAAAFEDCESLGRFVIVQDGNTVLQGKIESVQPLDG